MNSIFIFYAMTWGEYIFYKALERKFERYYSYFSLKLTLGGIRIHDIFLCMLICFLEILGLLLTTSCLFKRHHLFVVLGCPMVAYVAFHKSWWTQIKRKKKKNCIMTLLIVFNAKNMMLQLKEFLLVVKIGENEMRIVFKHLTPLQKSAQFTKYCAPLKTSVSSIDIIQPSQIVKVEVSRYCMTWEN